MKKISRKRKRQSALITNLFLCLFLSFFSQIQCTSSNNHLFVRSVPRGYQPPPTPPLVEDVPVMQYKLYKPPSRFSHPSTNNLPTFKHPSIGEGNSNAKEPLMVNTLIQVFGPNNGDDQPAISESEKPSSNDQNSPITPPPNLNGQKRVTITRKLDTEGRTYVDNQANSTSNPKIAIIKAFAASNSSQISEAQLREELGKELEQSVSLILDELGRKDKSKQHVTSTHPVSTIGGEELERLDEENEGQIISSTERSQKETENSIVSTREAITEQQTVVSTTVAPLLVFSKTKEPIEVAPAASITTIPNKEVKEESITTIASGNNEEQKEEIENASTTVETQTEENIVETKSTTITIAQIYKNSEEKIESPIATTNSEEIQSSTSSNKQPENELNQEKQEKQNEEHEKLTVEGSIKQFEKKTTTEEIAFAEEEVPSTELAPSEEEQNKPEETTKTTTTPLQTKTENVQIIKEEEEEEVREQKQSTTINVGREQQPGPGWQRTDFEEGQLWVQCKPPSIRALLWPWPTNRTFENGVLFAKDYHEESDCYAELDKDSGGGARLDIGPGKCGLAGSKNNISQTPQNFSVVLMFAPRRSLVIAGPEFSFLVQCYTPVLPTQQKLQQLTADLAIQKPLANPVMTKTIELSQTPPRCEYSLRRNSPDGPLLQRATLGQTIYHRWECEGGQEVAEQFGILLSDCVVANLTQEGINNNNNNLTGKTSMVDLIDSEGCSTDTLIVNDPEYEKDNLVAYAKAKVFSLRPESHFLRFSCKLNLCLRQNDGCQGLTPPKCPPTNVSRFPSTNHHPSSEKTPAALSQQLISPQLVVNSNGKTSSSANNTSPPRLSLLSSAASSGNNSKSLFVDSVWSIGLVLGVSVLLGLFFGLATFLLHSHYRRNQQKRLVQWVLARPPSSSSSGSALSSQEAGYIGRRGISIEAIQQHSDDYLPTEIIRIKNTQMCSPSGSESDAIKERQ